MTLAPPRSDPAVPATCLTGNGVHLAALWTAPQVSGTQYRAIRTVDDFGDRLRTSLPDRYPLKREIGRGGMSVVYLARDLQHDRDVAIKALRPELALAGQMSRFLQEIQLTARFVHPHILPLYESGDADGILYYVMPFVETGSLRDRLLREKMLALEDVCLITRQIAEALDYAHSIQLTMGEGVVHRDIKPENVLLTGSGHALVADFGIARIVSRADSDRLSSYGLIVGTCPYMSPEQCAGNPDVDSRSDIYSLGCVVYEMLCGTPPFSGASNEAISRKHIHETPPSLRVVRPELPGYVQAAVEKALAKTPADRFRTCAQFAEALATPVSPARAGWKKLAAVMAGVAVIGVTAWSLAPLATGKLDPNKVVVFPLVEMGSLERGDAPGEQVALMIGSALEHTDPLKWIYGWTWLDTATRSDISRLTPATARQISRARGARYYIDGTILGWRDSAVVILRLTDVAGDSLVVQGSHSGKLAQTSLPRIGLQAINEVLPRLLQSGQAVELGTLADREPAAIASWLQGEREFRASHFIKALEYFRRAVGSDSSMALAALSGAQAAYWTDQDDEAARLVDIALSRVDLLPTRFAELGRGFQFYLQGAADSAVAHLQNAVRSDSGWAGAWMTLGDTYYHLLPSAFALDSLARASFERAARLDPEFAPPLFHLAEFALRAGDVNRAEGLIARFQQSDPDTAWTRQLNLMLDCVRGRMTAQDWAGAAGLHAETVLQAAKALAAAGAQPACAENAFRAAFGTSAATINVRWGALLGLQSLLVAEERFDEVAGLLDSAIQGGIGAARGLYVLNAVAAQRRDTTAAAVVNALGTDYEAMNAGRLWHQGLWQAHVGDVAGLFRIVESLARIASASGSIQDRVIARGMEGRLALLEGDSARARTLLEGTTPVGTRIQVPWGLWEPQADDRMLLAEILLAQGRPAEALRAASVFDHPQPVMFLLYLRRNLELRVRASQMLGSAQAGVFRSRLAALRRAAS